MGQNFMNPDGITDDLIPEGFTTPTPTTPVGTGRTGTMKATR
jgi:hypothetical protein